MIQVQLSTQALHPARLADYSGTPLLHGWTDSDIPRPQYRLISDAKSFLFSVRVEGAAQCQRHPFGAFVQGLWEEDVAELFLLDESGTGYQEFNISPTGAWWSQSFSAPRTPSPETFRMPKRITPICQIRENYWEAGFFFSFEDLSVKNRLRDQNRANINVITGMSKRQYFSAAKLPGETPDFHQPASFEQIITGFS